MTIYSSLLTFALLLSSPWWLWRMLTDRRYRAGIGARLGKVPAPLREATAGREAVWLHAVSVGELLAAERLIARLAAELPGSVIVVSTTTPAGFRIARERLPGHPVFLFPFDFAFAVKPYLQALRPRLLVLMESELWPRMLVECERAHVPVAVVNARISDRSLPRYLLLKALWRPLLKKVSLFCTQGDETAERLLRIGVAQSSLSVAGNLKYDQPVVDRLGLAQTLRQHLPQAEFIVCGSTVEGEEILILDAWARLMSTGHRGVLLIAPRQPGRFDPVAEMMGKHVVRLSRWLDAPKALELGDVLLLDSIGSLAAVYRHATVAVVGGSFVAKGGHNPLEPARFGVPVIMGPSYENFREMVDAMRAQNAILIVEDGDLTVKLHFAMSRGRAIGQRGQAFFASQTGATERTLGALLHLVRPS